MLLTLVLLVEIPGPASTPTGAPPAAGQGGWVTFRTDATSSAIAQAGGRVVEPYDAFTVAEGPASVMALLQAEGHFAEILPGVPYLHLLTGDVDVRTLAAPPESTWTLDTDGQAVGLVHFFAPVKQAWEDQLQTQGVQPVAYVPDDAFVVSGTPAALAGLRSLPYVDWVGPYEAAWKAAPSLLSSSGIQDVDILVFPGEPTNAVVAWLAHAGVPARTSDPSGPVIVGAFGSGDVAWVRARVPAGLIPSIATLPEVQYIDSVVPVQPLNYNTDWVLQTNVSGDYRYWSAGLNGTGQVVGIADTGLDYDNPQFRQNASAVTIGDLYNVTDAARRKVVRYLDMGVLTGQLTWPGGGGPWDPYSMMDCANGHGTSVASTLAGNAQGISGDLDNGNALGTQIYMEDVGGLAPGNTCTNGGETLIYVPQDYADLFGPPGLVYNDPVAPVRIQSDSWGGTGDTYDLQAQMVDAFVWSHPDFLILFAAGNGGPTAATIDTPGTAKDIVTVGGACNPDGASSCTGAQNDLADFSSRGPTQDGRLKPDIVTIADGYSATSSGNAFDCPTYPTNCVLPGDHAWAGTSYATPAAAAVAAIIRQYFTQGWYPSRAPVAADGFDPSAALLRAMLLASGQQLTGAGTSATTWPNNDQGFGRVLLSSILPLPGDPFDTQVVDDHAGLLTGQAASYTFHVVGGASSARFVLTWTDYPGTLGAAKALVNDLDLQVTAPNGTVYRGNNFGPFASGESVPGGTFDATNTEEAVLLKDPAPGDWRVQVIAADVPMGPQPFALVATGGLDPGYGRVVLDKTAYSENDTIHITVYDANATAVSVQVTSGLEPVGETVALTQAAPAAAWTGSIRTAFGQPAPDGILEVRNGDTITVTYRDTNPPHTATATATVAATPPTVYGVAADQIQATSAEVHWTTDRPADSRVEYGTTPTALNRSTDETLLQTSHTLDLTGLQANTTYFYDVVSADNLGHVTVDTNGGRLYVFRTPPWGDVLLVVGDATFPVAREASYEAALDAFGWTWSVWHVSDLGLPPLSLLQSRRAVIWQVGLEEYPTFNTTAQGLVKAYLDGGGRLLIFSHDTSWSLGSAASPWYNATNVAWLAGVLKVSFACDPTSITEIVGTQGDPVSGAYAGGTGYTPHRAGGADDEVTPSNLGGTSVVPWRDGGVSGCVGNAPIATRWVSGANNGSAGVGVWGGTPSRLEYDAFEITSVDTNATDLRIGSAVRAQILDNSLRWLVGISTTALDRDHPEVSLLAPEGGSFGGPAITVNWTAAAFGPGIGLASFSLAYSPDGGQTWIPVATVGGSSRSLPWNLTGVPNGNAYLLQIIAVDSGQPTLQGQDVSNETFAINRTGGDTLGPVIWAGSLQVGPDPPGAAAMATFNATADDSRSGDSAISAAELFWSTAVPTAPNGSGLPMVAADGSFDQPQENVTWSGPLAIAPGRSCAWVHAEDAAGNWGPFNVTCFVVIDTGPDVLPPAPARLSGVRLANGGVDLQIFWRKAWDDSLYGGTVAYRVWRASAAAGPYALVGGSLPATDATNYSYTDAGRGTADAANEFYRIETIDAANNTEMTPAVAAKVWLPVTAGLNLLGMSMDPGGLTLDAMANGLGWSEAWTYDACGGGFGWSRWTGTGGPPASLAEGQGFWFNASVAGRILTMGVAPVEARVRLCPGWNLIALPGFLGNVTMGQLRAATGAVTVVGFDPLDPYHTRILNDSAPLASGQGYWVDVPAGAVWTVAGW